MSGGSFNYLYQAPWSDSLYSQLSDIEKMREVLAELQDGDAAAEDTQKVLTKLAEASDLALKLQDVWRAVEWWQSFDWSKEDAIEAAKKYKSDTITQ